MVRFILAEKARLQHPQVYRAGAREASAAGSVFLLGRGWILFQLTELLL